MFKNLFKGKAKDPKTLVEQILQDLLEKGGFSLSVELKQEKEGEIFVEIFGEDEGLLKMKEGRFLLALQTYLNRVIQHHFFGQNIFIHVDSGNFFEEREQMLLDLAERLKRKALSTGRPVYLKKTLSLFIGEKYISF